MGNSEKHIALTSEIKILQSNVKELQAQLADAHKRIGELTPKKDATEEVIQQQQLLQELKVQVAHKQEKLNNKRLNYLTGIKNLKITVINSEASAIS